MKRAADTKSLVLPVIAKRQLSWFIRYIGFYLRRNFHSVHLLRTNSLEQLEGWPLLICLNHPSWWDPLMSLYLSQRLFPERQHFGPIASVGLEKYKFFERLGFFGIDPSTAAGAQRFLRIGEAVLGRNDCALWVTPQGEFIDVRQRPVVIQGGVGHLAHRMQHFAMVPLALEYSFWNERFPEVFAYFCTPLFIENGMEKTAREWNALFSRALEDAQGHLSGRVQLRDPSLFEPLIKGGAGIGGAYDLWRNLKARVQGKKFEAEHGRI